MRALTSASTTVSARSLVLATLLNATIARTIVQSEKLAIVCAKKSPTEPAGRPPLHPILLMRALAAAHGSITRLLQDDTSEPLEWRKLLSRLRRLGHDPNWRRRPSVLDRIQGLTAPPKARRARRLAAYRNGYPITHGGRGVVRVERKTGGVRRPWRSSSRLSTRSRGTRRSRTRSSSTPCDGSPTSPRVVGGDDLERPSSQRGPRALPPRSRWAGDERDPSAGFPSGLRCHATTLAARSFSGTVRNTAGRKNDDTVGGGARRHRLLDGGPRAAPDAGDGVAVLARKAGSAFVPCGPSRRRHDLPRARRWRAVRRRRRARLSAVHAFHVHVHRGRACSSTLGLSTRPTSNTRTGSSSSGARRARACCSTWSMLNVETEFGSSAHARPARRSGGFTKKDETDVSRYDWTKAKRGRLLARARRSLAPALLDPELVAYFESPEAINAALRAIVDAAQLVKPAKAKARRPAKEHVA